MNDKGKIIIYQKPDGTTSIGVKLEKDTAWLNRQQMMELFGRDVKTTGNQIGNALKEDLEGMSTVAKFAIVGKFPAFAVANCDCKNRESRELHRTCAFFPQVA